MLRVQIPFQDRDIPKMPSNDIVPVKYDIMHRNGGSGAAIGRPSCIANRCDLHFAIIDFYF